jgi:2-polyprenyl-3-methyl-5-hydroxy-6-metoxy-1,4-benzoquinol methylase
MTQDYQGLHTGAAPGLHEAAFALLQRHVEPCRVLDLGCGAGAFTQRLIDHGYDAVGIDVDTRAYDAGGKVWQADLNGDWVEGTWPAISAVEVIEHLENPRHFFRQAAQHLTPGGWCLVTTPNIESAASRVMFLIRGEYRWFEHGAHYRTSGHITPLTQWLLDQAAGEAGFGRVATIAGPAPEMGRKLRALTRLLRPLMRGAEPDDVRVCLYRLRVH